MRTTNSLASTLLLSILTSACASPQSEPAETPAPTAEPAATPSEEPASEKLSAEEEAKLAAQKKLEEERAEMQALAQVEQQRWTPELREQSLALATTKYASVNAAMPILLKSAHRTPGHAARDGARKPKEVLNFFRLKPTMTVVEYGPGEGWYTELLAPLLATQGKLWVTTNDPAGPPEERATFYAERLDLFLKKSPEVYGKVGRAISPPTAPKLELDGQVDLALVIRGMHGMVGRDQLGIWLDEIHRSLKADGVLGVVQHRGIEGADPKESAKKGYLPEAWLIEQIESHGFKLSEKSELLANPRDTKDYADGVWALPPVLRYGETDRAKYEAIGESDRMTLRFKKVTAKP